jgi:hypothetical protein
MLNKKAYSIQMNVAVPDSEKRIAEKAEEQFENLLARLQDAADYLNLIYIPFQKHDNLDMEMIEKYRDTFRDYRDQVNKKLNTIIRRAYNCVVLMNEFSIDTSTEELMDSFLVAIRELEKYIDTFVSIFSNLNSQDFRQNLISTIDSIRKQFNQIKQLISDRILDHIDSNILAKNWASDVFKGDEQPIKEKVPLVIQLFKERQQALKENS